MGTVYQSKKNVNEQFGRKMNEDLNGKRIVLEGGK